MFEFCRENVVRENLYTLLSTEDEGGKVCLSLFVKISYGFALCKSVKKGLPHTSSLDP